MPRLGPTHTIFQLRVELAGVEPAVWRQLLVPGGMMLDRLHRVLQESLGWSDSHLHEFRIGETTFGIQEDEEEDYPDDEIDERSVSVAEAFGDGSEGLYEYDFGDGWEHRLRVDARLPQVHGLTYAVCLGGANAGPPDDIGGPRGYAAFLRTLDPGGAFDPAAFDIGQVNAALQQIR